MNKTELNKLTKPDLMSFMLFALYKIKEVPKFSAISELAYVLDLNNLLKLCEYFGGTTIQIPTIIELESLVRAFLLYQYVDIGGMSYSDAIKLLKYDSQEYSIIKQDYLQLKEFLNDYQTSPRGLE